MRSISLRSAAICAGVAAVSATAIASVIVAVTVHNPNFTAPATGVPPGSPAFTAATCSPVVPEVGHSAADQWTTFANDHTTSIATWLTVAPDGKTAQLVSTGDQGGLVQVLASPQGTPTDVNRVTATVYVLAGQVSIELGDGGAGGGAVAVSRGALAWEMISACGREDMLNNELVVYGVGPSVFYVSDVHVSFDKTCP